MRWEFKVMLLATSLPKVMRRERRVRSAIPCLVLQGSHCSAVALLVYAALHCSRSLRLSILKHSPLQRDGRPLAVDTYVSDSPLSCLSLPTPHSLGATLCHSHWPVMSLHAGRGLVQVFAERRVTSAEQSELRLSGNWFHLQFSDQEEAKKYFFSSRSVCSPTHNKWQGLQLSY